MAKQARQDVDFQNDLLEERLALAREMRRCPLCADGENSSKALHIATHQEGTR